MPTTSELTFIMHEDNAKIRRWEFRGTIDNKNQMEEINNAITLYYLKFIKEFREALDGEFGKGTKIFSSSNFKCE